MKKIFWEGGTLLAPVPPALVSCGTIDEPNVLTIGWTGIINTKPPMTYISVRPERYSYGIIKSSGEFVINLPTAALCKTIDFCGVRSGRKINKLEKCGLTPVNAQKVTAPLIDECPISLECIVKDIISLGSHDMFISEIAGVDIDEQYIDDSGRLNMSKCGLMAYAHGEYFALGKKIGSFGFSVKKKRKKGGKNKK